MNDAVTLKPGWEFPKDNLINLVELLIDRNQDESDDSSGFRARETKLFLRLRHTRKFNESTGYYLRGGVGRSINNQQNFNYAYIEPGLKYEFNQRWEWTIAVRESNSIDGTNGQRVRKFITGPALASTKTTSLNFAMSEGMWIRILRLGRSAIRIDSSASLPLVVWDLISLQDC
jgi:hypothetical protein